MTFEDVKAKQEFNKKQMRYDKKVYPSKPCFCKNCLNEHYRLVHEEEALKHFEVPTKMEAKR